MINVLFFAQVRELLGTAKLSIEANEQMQTAETLRAALAATDEKWAKVLT